MINLSIEREREREIRDRPDAAAFRPTSGCVRVRDAAFTCATLSCYTWYRAWVFGTNGTI